MLQKQTILPETLEILTRLQALNSLGSFMLGGGTALALRYGHRMSDDIDLFSSVAFDVQVIKKEIATEFSQSSVVYFEIREKCLLLQVDQIKIDLLSYEYPLLNSSEVFDNITLMSEKDNICMKWSAMANRGTKKDFYDVHEILKRYQVREVLDWYGEKYDDHEIGFVLRSAVYFADAEKTPDPISLIDLDWLEVKSSIKEAVSAFL